MNEAASRQFSPPLIIGHRGASALAPENTLCAFRRAMSDGADGIEFDVRLARDHVPVVIHDATLRRTALREGAVADFSSSELSGMDVGTWFNLRHPAKARAEYAAERIPTLARVFDLMREHEAVLYVEMKCDAGETRELAAEVVRLVRQYAFVLRVVVESFDLAAIREIKRLAPEIRTAALFEPKLSRPLPSPRRIIEQARQHGADELALHRSLAGAIYLRAARRHGLPTVVWTVDSPAWAKRALGSSVNGIITNRPAEMRARLNQLLAARDDT